jgi:hypothetical protein
MKLLIDTINQCRFLHNFVIDEFDSGIGRDGSTGGTGGGSSGVSGGTGGGSSGTTSSIIVPTLSLSPNTPQSVAIGTSRCFEASGTLSLPMEPEATADLDLGCSTYSGGTFTKSCGTPNNYNSSRYSSRLIPKGQPFHIVGRNSSLSSPGSPTNDISLKIGVRTTGGYTFIWEVYKYCNATPGNCGSPWYCFARLSTPQNTVVTLGGGLCEFNQLFKVKSDGISIIWEYTTFNNWAYNNHVYTIPADAGDFIFEVDALFNNNTWNELKTYRGSYQATITDFTWTTNAPEGLVINGNQACYNPLSPGSYQVCVSSQGQTPICVDVTAVPLFLNPQDKTCATC